MQRQRGELVPIGEVVADLNGPVKALREASPQARHHFTRFDQVNQLVGASAPDPDLGFMARLLALCSLPRTNPGDRLQYKRQNGPFKLVMVAGADNKLPFGNIPRLLLAWVSTEAVRTQSRELVLGKSLSGFMRALGIYHNSAGRGGVQTRLRNQMKRLFGCTVSLIYEDESGFARITSSVAHERGRALQAALRSPSALADGVDFDGGRAHSKPRVGSRGLAVGFHAGTRHLQQRRQSIHSAPQPDGAPL